MMKKRNALADGIRSVRRLLSKRSLNWWRLCWVKAIIEEEIDAQMKEERGSQRLEGRWVPFPDQRSRIA